MDDGSLAKQIPMLYHVAAADSWPAIAEHGLLSTSALLELHGVDAELREAIESRPRSESFVLDTPGKPRAVIRDQRPQRPLRPEHLLGGMTVGDWCRLLNSRVCFFPRPADAARLTAAYPGQTIYRVATALVLERHGAAVELAGINAGYAMRRPALRGLSTFTPPALFAGGRVAELTVLWSVPDFAVLVAATL